MQSGETKEDIIKKVDISLPIRMKEDTKTI